MFIKGDMAYADAYKYLKAKERNAVALQVQAAVVDEYEEIDIVDLNVSVSGKYVFWCGKKFLTVPRAMTREGIKTAVVKTRYSNDDQIAIMLNKDENENSALYYQKMQEWRAFASDLAKKAFEK